MKRFARALASVVVLGAAAAGIYSCSYRRIACSMELRIIDRRSHVLLDLNNRLRVVQAARENIERLDRCLRNCPADVDAYMLAAVNHRLLGSPSRAAEMYDAALRYDRRPELYLNLGTMQLELGQRETAIENLVRARVFNQFVDDEVPASVRDEVRARALAIMPDRLR